MVRRHAVKHGALLLLRNWDSWVLHVRRVKGLLVLSLLLLLIGWSGAGATRGLEIRGEAHHVQPAWVGGTPHVHVVAIGGGPVILSLFQRHIFMARIGCGHKLYLRGA